MATGFSTILKLALPVQGELSGTWGTVVNENITSMVEEAIAGRKVINTWSTNSATLSSADGTTSESRAAMLEFTDTGSSLSGAATVICPANSKLFVCKNAAGQQVTVKTASGTGVAVPNGTTMFLFCDGTNVEQVNTNFQTLKFNGNALSFGGAVTTAGALTTSGANALTFTTTGTTNVTLPTTGTVSTLAGSETFTNKSLTAPILTGSSSAAGSILFKEDTDNGTNSATLIGPASTADVTITLPAATDTLVGKATTDTLTNKTIDVDNNTVSNIEVDNFKASVIVTESEGIGSNDNDTTLPTSAAVKDYVDTQIQTEDTLAELNDTNISSLSSGQILIYDGSDTFDNKSLSGDVTVNASGVVTIANDAVETAMVNVNVITGQSAITSGVDTSNDTLLLHDADAGLKKISVGNLTDALGGLSNVVSDTTPQLGGALDVNGNAIVSTSDGDIAITPNGTGSVVLDDVSVNGKVITLTGSSGDTATLTAGTNGTLAITTTDTAAAAANITITADGTAELAGTTVTLNSSGGVTLDADGGTITFADGGASLGTITSDGFTGNVVGSVTLPGSSSAAGSILFKEDTDNGTNAVTLIGPAATADVTVTLPASTGTVALTSDVPSAGISSGNVATFTSGAVDNDFLRIDGTAIEGRSASEVLSDIGGQAALTFGISNTNIPIFTSGVADDDFLRIAGTSVEGRSAAEVLSDIGASAVAGSSSIVTTGALDAGSITSGFGTINNGASSITTTGVITGGTVEATADTSAGDNAAIGFTAAEGLILTGQGSTNDVTIKNDADADVIEIPTGTTNVTVAGGLTVGTVATAKTDTDTSNTGSVTLDFSANQNFVLTLTGNVTLANPSTETVGQSGFIVCIQDGTGGRTLSLGTDYETAAGAGITLSSAASATDIIPYVVAASNRILLGAPQLAFS